MMKVNKSLLALLFVSPAAFSYNLLSDPWPTTTGVVQPTACKFYFDSAAAVKVNVQTCTTANPCAKTGGGTQTTGVRCFVDLSTVTLSNGSHSVKATGYVDHPTSPTESDFSNIVNFTWPIPPVPGIPTAPGFLQLTP